VLAQAPGDHVVGEVDPAAGGGPAGDGLDAAASAAGVSGLLAAGAEGDFQRGSQGVQVAGVQAGERGMVQQAGGAAAGWLRWRGGDRVGGGRGDGPDGVVPFAVHGVPVQDAVAEIGHPLVADLGPGGVGRVVQDGGDLQAGVGGGRGDAGHRVLLGHQRPGPPGAGDVAEQPVLDLVPLAGAGREVAHPDLQPGMSGPDGQLVFPQPAGTAVGPAGVAGDQQPLRARVAGRAVGLPPLPQRVHRERGRVMAGAHRHEPPVGGDVVDPVRDDLPRLRVREAVVADRHRIPRRPPRPAVPVIRAQLLLLLRIHADHRLPGRPELHDHRVDVPELGVAVRVPLPLDRPRHPLQAVAVLPQHPRDRVLPAPQPPPGQLPLQIPQRQRAPGDLRHRITPRGRLDQLLQRRP
jgi:hypothetical protein